MTQDIRPKWTFAFLVISAWIVFLAACSTGPTSIPPALTSSNSPGPTPSLGIFSPAPLTEKALSTHISISLTSLYAPTDLPNLTPGPGIFSGYYINSFEASAFIPCTRDGSTEIRTAWWLITDASSDFWNVAATVVPSLPTQTTMGWKAFLRFEGNVSGLGHYGHLGKYAREITVIRILEMSAPKANGRCN